MSFKIVKAYSRLGDFGTFEKYTDATKARMSLEKETGAFYEVIDLDAVTPAKVPVDPMWINKDEPRHEFRESMYGSACETGNNDQPEGYMGD